MRYEIYLARNIPGSPTITLSIDILFAPSFRVRGTCVVNDFTSWLPCAPPTRVNQHIRSLFFTWILVFSHLFWFNPLFFVYVSCWIRCFHGKLPFKQPVFICFFFKLLLVSDLWNKQWKFFNNMSSKLNTEFWFTLLGKLCSNL